MDCHMETVLKDPSMHEVCDDRAQCAKHKELATEL